MQARNTTKSWGWVTRLLHWTMAGLILFQLGLGYYMMNILTDLIAQFRLTQTHKSWGFVVFALALLRVVWRLFNRQTPALPEGTPRWQHISAEATHGLLYVLMLALPISGWVMSAASPTQDLLNIENMVFGLFALPDPWTPGNRGVADAAEAVHYWASVGLAVLLVLHAGAALKHHFIDRDNVLARMTFGR